MSADQDRTNWSASPAVMTVTAAQFDHIVERCENLPAPTEKLKDLMQKHRRHRWAGHEQAPSEGKHEPMHPVGTATRVEVANMHDDGTHWSEWRVASSFDRSISHEEEPVVLLKDAQARIDELLEANNRYLQEARDARAQVRKLEVAVGALVNQAPTSANRCIVAAAVRYGDVTVIVPRPGRHHTIINGMFTMIGGEAARHEIEQGFLTNHGEFVGREQGYAVAKASGQLVNDTARPGYLSGYLFSEDLW